MKLLMDKVREIIFMYVIYVWICTKNKKIKVVKAIKLGMGKAYTVLEIIKAFEKASSKKIPFKIVERRAGDIASCYSNPKLVKDF